MHSTITPLLVIIISGLSASAADLAMQIVVADPGTGSRIEVSTPRSHFHLVITNTSKTPQRICDDTCSWGYDALSFRITDALGKERVVRRLPKSWRGNYPRSIKLMPGEMFVMDVFLGDRDMWPALADLKGIGLGVVRMSASFTIAPDVFTARVGVWTGSIHSAEGEYVFR